MHKIIFNNRSILSLEGAEVIPIEAIGGRRLQATTPLVLNKKLTSDIAVLMLQTAAIELRTLLEACVCSTLV